MSLRYRIALAKRRLAGQHVVVFRGEPLNEHARTIADTPEVTGAVRVAYASLACAPMATSVWLKRSSKKATCPVSTE